MIFIDTSYLISLILSMDSKHKRSIELIPLLNEKRIINNVVLTETLNTFTKKNETDTYELYRKISHTHEIIYLKEEDYEDSVRLHSYYHNALNYFDCTILKLCKIRVFIK